jgi:hypothetical protein
MIKKYLSAILLGLAFLLISFSLIFDVSIKPSPLIPYVTALIKGQPVSPNQDLANLSYQSLSQIVTPISGKTVLVEWGDVGQKLVSTGAINLTKFESRYGGLTPEQVQVLTGNDLHQITFTKDNIQFWTNVLWALGLTQNSKVLDEGPMTARSDQVPVENYASTAGWTLGSKDAMELYSSQQLIALTQEQQELVYKIGENIFRPCCGNHTSYPDCNHGMAVLGLIELMVSQEVSEEEIYEAALAFNSYAFENTYITTAAYLAKQGIGWEEVSAYELLGPQYSSGQGAANISQLVGEVPGAPKAGGSCGA